MSDSKSIVDHYAAVMRTIAKPDQPLHTFAVGAIRSVAARTDGALDGMKEIRAILAAMEIVENELLMTVAGTLELQKAAAERVQEFLNHLNSFIDHEYEYDTEIRLGIAVPVRTIVGSDFNLDKAIEWATSQPDVTVACGPDGDRATVELHDGTILAFEAALTAWDIESCS